MEVVARPSSGEGLKPGNEKATAVGAGADVIPGSRTTPDDKATLRFRNDIDRRNGDVNTEKVLTRGCRNAIV